MKQLIRIPIAVLSPLRNYLIREQQKLLKRKDELQKEDPFRDVTRVDDNADVGQEASEQWGHQRVEALRNEIDKTLINVRKALTRIKIGRYGLCEQCGHLIDTDRLAVNPTATLCIDCERKSQREKKTLSRRR